MGLSSDTQDRDVSDNNKKKNLFDIILPGWSFYYLAYTDIQKRVFSYSLFSILFSTLKILYFKLSKVLSTHDKTFETLK